MPWSLAEAGSEMWRGFRLLHSSSETSLGMMTSRRHRIYYSAIMPKLICKKERASSFVENALRSMPMPWYYHLLEDVNSVNVWGLLTALRAEAYFCSPLSLKFKQSLRDKWLIALTCESKEMNYIVMYVNKVWSSHTLVADYAHYPQEQQYL
jgi:hypothetical protein